MQAATFENFVAAYDTLKATARSAVSNIFLNRYDLSERIKSKCCLQYVTENSIFLLVPTHDSYYDLLFCTKDKESMAASLTKLLSEYCNALPIRCSIVGKEPLAGELSQLFEKKRFSLIKKLLRMRLAEPETKVLEAMRPYAEEYRGQMSFAHEKDAEEILSILLDNFDPAGDNLPELQSIREHIAQKNIAVLRKDGKIVSLHYFSVQNSTLHALYDVTRKEYRGGNGFFMALAVFVHDYFLAQGKRHTRLLGWRDAAKQKLLKHARKSNQTPDGVVIYNMLWTPDEARNVRPEAHP